MHRPPVGISDSNTTTLSVTICPFRYRVNRFRTYSCRKIKTALQQPRIVVPGLDRGIHAFLGSARRSLLLSSSRRKPGPIVEQHSAAKWVPAFAGTTEERFNSKRSISRALPSRREGASITRSPTLPARGRLPTCKSRRNRTVAPSWIMRRRCIRWLICSPTGMAGRRPLSRWRGRGNAVWAGTTNPR